MKFKNMTTLVAALVMSTSVVFARDYNRRSNGMNQQTKVTQGHMDEGQMMSGYNAPSRYDVRGAWDFFFTGDFLYWQVREGGLQYGTSQVDTTANGQVTRSTRALRPDFGWGPGVKIGAGLNFEHDNWDLYLQWTHLVSKNNTSSGAPTNGEILPSLLIPYGTNVSADRAFMSWSCVYNTMDLEMARSYYVGKYLTFRPYAGVRGAWIRQKYNAQYNLNSNNGITHVLSKYNTWSLGPRVGMGSNWMIGQGFRLFGNTAFSLLWTSVSARKNQNNPTLTGTENFEARDSKGNSNLRPNTEAEFGFGWGSYFDNANWHFDLSLSYEFHYWWDYNFDIYVSDSTRTGLNDSLRGNLALHGATVRARFDF